MKSASIVTWCLLLLACAARQACGQPVSKYDQVVAAWKKRQEECKSFRIVYEYEYLYTKGSASELLRRESNIKSATPSPEHRGVHTFEIDVRPRSVKLSYVEFSVYPEQLKQTRITATESETVGVRRRESLEPPFKTDGHRVSVKVSENRTDLKSLDLEPIMYAIRSADKRYSVLQIQEYKYGGQQVKVDGVTHELFVLAKTGQSKKELWLCPEQDWLPVRQEIDWGDMVSTRKMTNEIVPGFGWMPKRWSNSTFYRDGMPTSSFTCTAKQIEINHRSDEVETLVFPPGLTVIDEAGPGSVKRVTDADGNLPSEPGSPSEPGRVLSRWAIGLAVGIAIIGIAVFYFRRSRRGKTLFKGALS